MSNFFVAIGHAFLAFLAGLGSAFLLMLDMLRHIGQLFLRPRLLFSQIYNSGVLSLLIISVSSIFVGMVLALQGYNVLSQFGSTEIVGYMVAASLMRELGPVVTALLFAGRAGSALTAEIGIMKATEQLAGLEMMAVNPVSRIYLPRFFGGIIAMPVLAAIFITLGVFGGYLVSVGMLGIDSGAYWSQMQSRVELHGDIINGLIKSVVFGVAVSWIAIYQGIASVPTSEGIGRATTRSVVYASLLVLGLDFILTALMFGG